MEKRKGQAYATDPRPLRKLFNRLRSGSIAGNNGGSPDRGSDKSGDHVRRIMDADVHSRYTDEQYERGGGDPESRLRGCVLGAVRYEPGEGCVEAE